MSMRLFDTHCHFETAAPEAVAPMLERARAAGVERILAVGGSAALNAAALAARALARSDPARFPRVDVALGFDREQALSSPDLSALGLAGEAALGEMGLDYHYARSTRAEQLALFRAELERARALDLPVVIHTREADDDTLSLLREVPVRGIIHSYTGTAAAARQFLELGFYVSFSGIVTFRLADNVREAARAVPDGRLLVETDSPYLAPVPVRGRPCEPAFVAHTCALLARERGLTAEALAEITFANAERVLGV